MAPAQLSLLLWVPLSYSSSPAFEHWVVSVGWPGLARYVLLLRVSHLSPRGHSRLTFEIVFIVTVAVGLQDRPSAAPVQGDWKSDYKITNSPSFTDAISAISTLVFTYAGTPGFFNIAAEMRDPHLYTRSLAVCQITVTSVYIIVATIVYYFCGSYVASPALGSAGPLIKKVAYGVALPGLAVSGILLAHVRKGPLQSPTIATC